MYDIYIFFVIACILIDIDIDIDDINVHAIFLDFLGFFLECLGISIKSITHGFFFLIIWIYVITYSYS